MVRLGIALVVAVIIGIAGGILQFRAGYSGVDERLASFRATSSASAGGEAARADQAESETPEPRAEVVGGTIYDFGTMQQGSSKSHTFVFRNIGTAPLDLKVGATSCRCTIGSLADSSLKPGEQTEVTLEWKATGVLDKFGQTATIVTNDPQHHEILLSVKGTVARTILVEPPGINLGELSVSSPIEQTAYVFAYTGEPLEISDAAWADPDSADKVHVKVTPMPVDKKRFPDHQGASGAAQIDLQIEPGLPMGPLDTRITMHTNVKNVSTIDLPVIGKVVGDLQMIGGPSYDATNSILNLGKVDRHEGTTARLHLSVQGPERQSIKLEVGEVVPKDSLIVTIGEPKEQSSRVLYPIICTVPKDAPAASYPGTNPKNFGKVVIKTSHPNIPEFRLFVRLNVE
ncbi:MAG: DUF1573 domain-containing protein [Aureliella sp.]